MNCILECPHCQKALLIRLEEMDEKDLNINVI